MYSFEIHLTTQPLTAARLAQFGAACRHLGAKPLVIELARGVATTQPMLSKVVRQPTLAAALAAATRDADYLRAQHLPPTRLKLETAVAHRHLAAPGGFAPYFEWHGKVPYQRAAALLAICEQHRAHLSANALKGELTRFVTLREFGSLPTFEARVAALAAALAAEWPLLKQEAECCLYDSNTALDAGWLPG